MIEMAWTIALGIFFGIALTCAGIFLIGSIVMVVHRLYLWFLFRAFKGL